MRDVRSLEAKMLYGYFLSLSSDVFTRTSSHMCDIWYLPIFLFSDASLAFMATVTPSGHTTTLENVSIMRRDQTLPDP